METKSLIVKLRKYLKENRHSLSDEDIKLLKRILVALENMKNQDHMDYVTLVQKTAQICDLVFRLFSSF